MMDRLPDAALLTIAQQLHSQDLKQFRLCCRGAAAASAAAIVTADLQLAAGSADPAGAVAWLATLPSLRTVRCHPYHASLLAALCAAGACPEAARISSGSAAQVAACMAAAGRSPRLRALQLVGASGEPAPLLQVRMAGRERTRQSEASCMQPAPRLRLCVHAPAVYLRGAQR